MLQHFWVIAVLHLGISLGQLASSDSLCYESPLRPGLSSPTEDLNWKQLLRLFLLRKGFISGPSQSTK